MMAGMMSCRMPLRHLGRLDEIPHLFETSNVSAVPLFHLYFAGDTETKEILEQWVLARPAAGLADDETPYFTDIDLLQAAVRVSHRPSADLLLHRFSDCAMLTGGAISLTCIPRHLGAAAALLGRYDEARKHYSEAVKVTTEMPFRPELALTRLQLAELLLEHYPGEKADALEHLDFAIKEFREMKMQPSLERALKLHSAWSQK
jgi:tetratricopeptide (TPR) repeat protein